MTDVRQKIQSIDEDRRELLALLLSEEGMDLGDSTILPRLRGLETYPLTPTQRGIWLVDRMQGGSSAYNLGVAYRLSGSLAVSAFDAAVGEIVERHEILRTVFVERDGEPAQKPDTNLGIRVKLIDVCGIPERESLALQERIVRRDHEQPFNLAAGPLLRVTIIGTGPRQWLLSVVLHHIVADAWSFAILVREMEACYTAHVRGKASALPAIPVQFADFALWRQKALAPAKIRGDLAYWQKLLAGAPPLLELPLDFPRPTSQSFRGRIHTYEIPVGSVKRFREMSRRYEATPFMSFQALCVVLLAHYSGQQDISIGSTVTNRQSAELEPMIGYLSDTLVFRNRVDDGSSFSSVIERVKATALAVFSHQNISLEQILEVVKPERNPAYSPLFQVMLELQNAPVGAFRLPGMEPAKISWPSDISRFDVSFGILDRPEGLRIEIEYCSDLFKTTTVVRMGRHFRNLMNAAAHDPEARLSAFSLLDEVERHHLVGEWNAAPDPDPERPLLHRGFEAAVLRGPDRIALVHGRTHLSYAGLNALADGVARALRGLGVGPERLVGLVCDRSPAMAAGILGILKCGAGFLPLDPINPARRLKYMLDDARPRVLLVASPFTELLSFSMVPTLVIDALPMTATASGFGPPPLVHDQNPAYAVYTSGSTGRPKGTLIAHRALAGYCREAAIAFGLTASDRFLQFAPLGFDVLVEELFPTWQRGAAAVLLDGESESFSDFGRFLAERRLTAMELPAAYWRFWLAELLRKNERPPCSLKLLIVGCETVSGPEYADWKGFGIPLISIFGLSETSITSSFHRAVPGDEDHGGNLPIGRPLANSRLYLLDRAGSPVPIGIVAELFVGGSGIGRGYLGKPALTAAAFVPDAWSGRAGARLYRTGDRARYLPGGEIRFLGRFDDQVKIRGFRIELGEIEAVLNRSEPVAQAAAAVSPGERPTLVAFVVPVEPKGDGTSLEQSLVSRCREALPDYMVPSAVVVLDRLPLSPNGKIDRRALPFPAWNRSNRSGEPPRGPTESRLAGIWCEVLRVEDPKATDNFFELGGHSLTAMQLLSRIRGEFEVSLGLIEVFEAPTIRGLAARLALAKGQGTKRDEPLRRVSREGALPLSFAQQRLWFLDRLEGPGPTYNVPLTLHIEGALAIPRLERAYADIIERHESLRTVFSSHDGRPVQHILDAVPPRLAVIDLERTSACAETLRTLAGSEMRRPFDLARGPLSRTVLFRAGPRTHVLQITVHHIVADGWSMDLLVEDWIRAYRARCLGEPPPFSPLAVQYIDFAVWQRRQSFEDQLEYWKHQLEGAPKQLELPTDRPRPPVQSFRGASLAFSVEDRLATALERLVRDRDATLFMGLQAVFLTLLYRYSHQQDLLVGSAVAGRNRPEIEPLVGFFVNPLVFRNDLSGSPSFNRLLARTRQVALAAFEHQDLAFEQIADQVAAKRDRSRSPLFQVMFDLQNIAPLSTSLPGLSLKLLAVRSGVAKFDLTLTMIAGGGRLSGSIEYNTDLFERETIHRMSCHFTNLLEAAISDPATPIDKLPILGEREKTRILERWSVSQDLPYALETMSALLEIQAAKTPDAMAVENAGDDPENPAGLTYGQLNLLAARFAAVLRGRGVGLESPVGVCLPRSAGMLVALAGIWKTGAVQVPLDPDNPWERLSHMIRDSGLMTLVAGGDALERLPAFESSFLDILTMDRIEIEGQADPPETPKVGLTGDHLAYIMYTSGSTGMPKGVAVPHRGLANYIQWCSRFYPLAEGRGAPMFGSLGFDATLTSIWAPLVSGKSVTMMPDRQPWESLAAMFGAEQPFSFVKATPSLLTTLERMPSLGRDRFSLGALVLGGEALMPAHLEFWQRRAPAPGIFNEYGPTEATVGCCVYEARLPNPSAFGVPIGRPIANAVTFLLDRALNPVPQGVDGEIFIGGWGLARGYLNQPALTAERFIPNPFRGHGARLYRSGDIARYLADGNLICLGRRDQQIKIRGVRVEPGEIEALLEAHPLVVKSVVLPVRRQNETELWAFLQTQASHPASISVSREPHYWRDHLREKLPDSMLPARFVAVETWPLTPNDKLDRDALVNIGLDKVGDRTGFRAPASQTEKTLAAIWAELLNREQVGADDDFFELGGHSLLAVQVISRVRDLVSVELAIADLFDAPTVAELSRRIESRQRSDAVAGTISPIPRSGELPLSFSQQRLWFLDRLEGPIAAYNIPYFLHLNGLLDIAKLRGSFGALIERHEILRTRFEERNSNPIQIIYPESNIRIPVLDLQKVPAEAGKELVQVLASRETRFGFDLSKGPLFRFRLCRIGPRKHVLFLNLHHTVSDGWSIHILVRELVSGYQAALGVRPLPLPDLPIQYADYAAWQRERLAGELGESQLRYWCEKLEDAVSLHGIPTDRPRSTRQSFNGATLEFPVAPELGRAVARLGREAGATPFMTYQAVFAALVHRYSGQHEVMIGTPVANRNRLETEHLIGCFVNTLVLRNDLSGVPGFRELLMRTRELALAAYAHQEAPFERIVDRLQPERGLSHTPLFQIMFLFEPRSPHRPESLPGLSLSAMATREETAQFDLKLHMDETEEGPRAYLNYNTGLFDAATAERLAGHFQILLKAVVDNPQLPISRIDLLNEGERGLLLRTWTQTRERLEGPKLIHALVGAQTARSPDSVAVSGGVRFLDYRFLDMLTSAVARELGSLGIGPETVAAVCLERSPWMVAALLGILKSGAAYLPLDPDLPEERRRYMVADAEARALVTGRSLADQFGHSHLPLVFADRVTASAAAPAAGSDPDHMAYVMFTSGSTGRPKGVVNAHRGVCNRLLWMRNRFPIDSSDTLLQKTPYAFDVSVWEFFWPLITGARLDMAIPGGHRDPHYLMRAISDRGITQIHFVPAMLRAYLQECGEIRLPGLKRVFCSGEALTQDLISAFSNSFTAELHNLYGPTEAAIEVTHYRCEAGPGPVSVPIGKPIANIRIYVLDRRMNPVPIGMPGELFIGGLQVARGYRAKPELTAAAFVPSPFEHEVGLPGYRLYGTGDLARFRDDGTLDYLGRRDHQVKVRGFRIEPGEIEAVLLSSQKVKASVVEVRGGAILAYVVPSGHGSESDLTTHLRDRCVRLLPHYMVPAAYHCLAALPLTPSGKVNRKALPDPEPAMAKPAGELGTATEDLLADIWMGLMGISRPGPGANFFELGGHSLLGTQLLTRIRMVFKVDLPLRAVFTAPTLGALAARIDRAKRHEGAVAEVAIERVSRDRRLPLSYTQEALWFLDRLNPGGGGHNMPVGLWLTGSLDLFAVERALAAVLAKHESLRTRIAFEDGEPFQDILTEPSLPLEVTNLEGLEEGSAHRQFRALRRTEAWLPFDLTRFPLLRLKAFRFGKSRHALLLTMHHIISDAWSMGLLVRGLCDNYRGHLHGVARPSPPAAAEPAIQFADYAYWQRKMMNGEQGRIQTAFWQRTLRGAPVFLDLPTDKPRIQPRSLRGTHLPVRLPAWLMDRFRPFCREKGVTLFMGLHAVVVTLLSRYSGQTDIVIGTPVANRNHRQAESLIGCFINTLALRCSLSQIAGKAGTPTFIALLDACRDIALDAYAHQEIPFERVVASVLPVRNSDRPPLFQVMLVLQNAPGAPISLPGLTTEAMEEMGEEAMFDLTLVFSDGSEGLSGSLVFPSDLFHRTSGLRLIEHFRNLVENAINQPELSWNRLEMRSVAERHQSLIQWNDSRNRMPRETEVVRELEARIRKVPDVAVLETNLPGENPHFLSYGYFGRLTARWAAHLCKASVGPEQRVGLLMNRGPDLVTAMVAVLKCGAAFVPLDPDYPQARLAFMARDCSASFILADPQRSIAGVSIPLIEPKIDFRYPPNEISRPDPPPNAAAYLIYTSGSSGKPKGVLISRSALLNFMVKASARYGLGVSDRLLQFASPSFDSAIDEVFSALPRGATVIHRSPEMMHSPEMFWDFCRRWYLTVLDLPTAFWHRLAGDLSETRAIPRSLRLIVTGGESLQVDKIRSWLRLCGNRPRLLDTYGPTESTVVATSQEWACPGLDETETVSIGRALENIRIYVMDAELVPQAAGIPGELCIGGNQLARGYHNRPRLTAERFVPNPISGRENPPSAGRRLYRTGDRVRNLPDGRLAFLGRLDGQVKLRGFRIELEEIGVALRMQPGISDAIVLCRTNRNDEPHLVAYLVRSQVVAAQEPESEALLWRRIRNRLSQSLPAFMIPAEVRFLAEFPLTPNQKVDVGALPELEASAPAFSSADLPRTEVEERLAAIWVTALGIERIGIYQNFFDIGGHSFSAMRISARINEEFGVVLPLRAIFAAPTVADLAGELERTLKNSAGHLSAPLRPAPRDAHAPLSFSQQRLWFLYKLGGPDPVYNIPSPLRLQGPLDCAALGKAVEESANRHESLRTVFPDKDGEPYQFIQPRPRTRLAVIDLSGLGEGKGTREAEALARRDAGLPFELEEGPLLRLNLVRAGAGTHVFLITMHHIVTDGWSIDLLVRELGTLYEAFLRGLPSPLDPPRFQYADYAHWQRKEYAADLLDRQLAYWERRLKDSPGLLDLPLDYPRPHHRTHEGGCVAFSLAKPLSHSLEALGRSHRITPFVLFQAAFSVLLQRYSGQEVVTFGTPVANRTRSEVASVIGFFVNTLVLRHDLSGNPSFATLLEKAGEATLQAFDHQEAPFEQVVERLQPDRNLSHSPLFQVFFTWQEPTERRVYLPGIELGMLPLQGTSVKFDLSFNGGATDGGFTVALSYNRRLFREETIERMSAYLLQLLEEIAADPGQPISQLALIGIENRKQLLNRWQGPDQDPDAETSLGPLLSARWPLRQDQDALIGAGIRLCYGALEGRIRWLSDSLRMRGVVPDTPVALIAERAVETVIAMLAVLRVGGAFVPLDPSWPPAMLNTVFRDSGADTVLCQSNCSAALPANAPNLIRVDGTPLQAAGHTTPPNDAVDGSCLAYLIYTSGSTGTPKGVGISRGALVNYLTGTLALLSPEPGSHFALVSSPAADLGFTSTFSSMCSGGRLHILNRETVTDGLRFQNYFECNPIDYLKIVPSHLAAMLGVKSGPPPLPRKLLILGGEPSEIQWTGSLRELKPGCSIFNSYGPTEATVSLLSYHLDAGALPPCRILPLRTLLPHTTVFILDPALEPVPDGISGQLFIGGRGLARGYWRRPGQTATSFIPNPYNGPGSRLYQTGDRVRCPVVRAGGAPFIEFLGRIDDQVKIRGYRVEPGEIVAVLKCFSRIDDAAVVIQRAAEETRLIAFVAPSLEKPAQGLLADFLKAQLPAHMIPAATISMEALPLNANGKLDRPKLARIALDAGTFKKARHTAPATPMEKRLAGIWREVLALPEIGAYDNFFEIGGHSLAAVRVVSRMNRDMNLKLNVVKMFEKTTIAEMAKFLDALSIASGPQREAPPSRRGRMRGSL